MPVRYHTPIVRMPEIERWSIGLEEVASAPLEFCEGFPEIARRFEAWWAQELFDRPVFIATANANPSRPITRRLDLLARPDAWFEAKFEDMMQTHRVGDSLPSVRVDFGPVLLGGMLGGRLEFGADTGWTHAFINDEWSNAPDWSLCEDNPWWIQLRSLTRRVAEDAVGRYLVCGPDLGGSADVLLNLRGSTHLCMDVIERPDLVRKTADAIYPAWRQAFSEFNRIVAERRAGLLHWLGVWSNRTYMIPACDFNFMISPAQFRDLFLPDIARQSATVGRAVFHLDGPGAANHIDALLEVPDIQAIQFTPGEGTPSALAWVEMFRKIQDRGRSILPICPAEEVLELCEALKPEGLAIIVTGALTPGQLDDLFRKFARRYSS